METARYSKTKVAGKDEHLGDQNDTEIEVYKDLRVASKGRMQHLKTL